MIALDIGSPIGKVAALARSDLGVRRLKRSSKKDTAAERVMKAILHSMGHHPSKTVVFVFASTYRELLAHIRAIHRYNGDCCGLANIQVLSVPVVIVDPLWYKQGKFKFNEIIWCL